MPALRAALFALSVGAAGCLSFHSGPMPGEPKNATFLMIDGARVRYLDRGKGPAVVLIHGFASSLDTWTPVIAALQQTHRVVALDLKGFGWTDRPEGDYSPRAQAKLVLGLLDHLGIDRAAVVAHSWGASVALQLALGAPDRVTRLALYDAWIYEDQLPTAFVWARAAGVGEVLFGLFYNQRAEDKIALAFFDPSHVTQQLVDATERALDRPGTTAAALAAVRGQRFAQVEKRYKDIGKPVLLLWGREDRVTQLKYGEQLSTELPNARLDVFPRCGHFPMIEAEHASTRALARFLAGSEPPFAAPAPRNEPPGSKNQPPAPPAPARTEPRTRAP